MNAVLLVGLGGAAGAVTRYFVGTVAPGTVATTLVVNVAGSLALGVIVATSVGDPIALALGTGFCGAFTTFSSFAVATVGLVEKGAYRTAITYAFGMLGAAIVAVVAGGVIATTLL